MASLCEDCKYNCDSIKCEKGWNRTYSDVKDCYDYCKKQDDNNSRSISTKSSVESVLYYLFNNIPMTLDPCSMCVNKKNDRHGEQCLECCYYYASAFELKE